LPAKREVLIIVRMELCTFHNANDTKLNRPCNVTNVEHKAISSTVQYIMTLILFCLHSIELL